MRNKHTHKFLKILYIIFLLYGFFPHQAFAQNGTVQAYPAPGSQWKVSPSEVKFTFDQPIKRDPVQIHILNEKGKDVVTHDFIVSDDEKEIRVPLSPLKNGLYMVSYQAETLQGKIIAASYVIYVGVSPANLGAMPDDSVTLKHHHGGISIVLFLTAYEISLLLLSGWLIWGMRQAFPSKAMRQKHAKFWKYLLHFYVITLVSLGFIQFSNIYSSLGFDQVVYSFFHTPFGWSWSASILLSISGYLLLNKHRWVDGIWVLFVLGFGALGSHANLFAPKLFSVTLMFIHLFMASIWIGGLLVIVVFWKIQKHEVLHWIPLYLKVTAVSMLVLIISGMMLTKLFLTDIHILIYTAWGIFWMLKIVVVLVLSFYMIKRLLTKKSIDWSNRQWWIRELVLQFFIILLVAGLSYVNPFISNAPLYWQVSTNGTVITTTINPNNPHALNSFTIQVVPAEGDTPKNVKMRLHYMGMNNIAPLTVPLIKEENLPSPVLSNNYNGIIYHSLGPFLPFPGNWRVEVILESSQQKISTFEKDITLYDVDNKLASTPSYLCGF